MSSNKIDVTASGNGPLTGYTGTLPGGWADAVATLQHVGVTVDTASPTALVRGNVIGTVAGPGIVLDAAGSLVDDNHIGIGLDGTTAIGNTGDGLDVAADNVTVGAAGTGTALTGTGNVIADNGGAGVNVAVNHTKVSIRSNSIHDNANGAIILSGNANAAVPAPQVAAAVQDGQGHTVVFVQGGVAGATGQIYAAANCPPGGADPEATPVPGQGQALLATATLGASLNDGVPVALQAVGASVDATITVDSLGTSQFSACAQVAPAADGSARNPQPQDGDTDTVDGSGFSPGEPVQGELHSTPIALGTQTADDDGDVTFSFTVPANLPAGQHYVILTGQTSGKAVAVPLTVTTTAPSGPLSPAVPSAPRSPAIAAGVRSVRLTWTAPASDGGTAITGYQVLRSTTGNGFTVIKTLSATTYSLTDTALSGGHRYWYELRAMNAAGTSPVTTALSAVPYAVPSAPRAPHASAGLKRITLTWAAPATANGAAITDYRIQRSTNGTVWTTIASTTARSRTITGLTGGRRYWLRVLAVNKAGTSVPSASVRATPYAAPSAPRSLKITAGKARLTLTWKAPASSSGAAITSYRVQYATCRIGAKHCTVHIKTVHTRRLVLRHLRHVRYYLRLAAVNKAGTGSYTVTTSKTPQPS